MNATTKTEQSALTLPERAAVALGSSKTETELRDLVKQSADIVAVANMAGRDQAHRIGMNLKTARVVIERTGKAAREDATAFGKAVIAEEKRLVGIIGAEEDRVFGLRDDWDTKVATERQAVIDAEVARTARIASAIEAIREDETDALRIAKTAEEVRECLAYCENRDISVVIYQDRHAEAVTLRATVLESIRTILAGRVAAEAVEAQRVADAKAEAARVLAERAELEQLRAAAAETARLTKIESDRVAAEQAAEAKRLTDLALAQQIEARRRQDLAAAELRAQAEAQAAAARAEQVERDRVSTAVKAQLEQQAAQLAADRRALDEDRAADAKAKADALAAIEAAQAPALVKAEPAAGQGLDSTPPAATWPFPSLRLGQIGARLGFTVTADFLRTLGFEPAARDKAAQLYHEHDFAMICAALTRHISAVQAKQAA